MKKNQLIVAVSFLVLIVSCGVDFSKHDIEESNSSEQKEASQKPSGESENLKKSLTNGKKWIANAATHEGMKNIQEMLGAVGNSPTLKYDELGLELTKQTDFIIEKCTMEGESHEQLHGVLHPILEVIAAFQKVKTPEEGQERIKELNSLLDKYFTLFDTK